MTVYCRWQKYVADNLQHAYVLLARDEGYGIVSVTIPTLYLKNAVSKCLNTLKELSVIALLDSNTVAFACDFIMVVTGLP